MSRGVQPESLDSEIDRAFKELDGRFDIADATDVDIVASVFGPVLERRVQESRKRSRSSEMSDLARRLAALAQSQEDEPTPKAKKTAGPSRSTRAKAALPVAKESSQVEKDGAEEESEPQRKKPRTARMTVTPRTAPAPKPKRRRGEVPPQTDANGVVPEERDLDKVVSSAILISVTHY